MPTRKTLKEVKKPAAKGSRQSLPTKGKSPGRKTTAAKEKRTSRKPSPSKSKSRGSGPANRSKPVFRFPGSTLTLDRKVDILGIAFSLVGLITFLTLFSANHSRPIEIWINAIRLVFGWGLYVFPLALITLGLWLVLRHFESLPQVAFERFSGFLLIFLNLLVVLHLFAFPQDRGASFALAASGEGGGYVGAFLFSAMHNTLGWGGTVVALAAWLLIALAMSLDVSVLQLFAWSSPIFRRVTGVWQGWQARRASTRKVELAPRTAPQQLKKDPARSVPSQPADSSLEVGGLRLNPNMTGGYTDWVLPPIAEILEAGGDAVHDDDIDRQRARLIEETLASFGAPARVIEINRGPTITQFGVEPGFIESRGGQTRVRVSKISALADDLALALSARRIRIQAPVPSKGFVGIEVPNEEIALVALRDVMESEPFKRLKSPLRFSLGQDVAGNPVAADLASLPHLLVAGTTGSGKSVCVNALICCLLLNNTPDNLRLIMVDPKRVELTGYNGIPHLLAPVVVELERVVGALQWVAREMDQRYRKLAQAGVRNIGEYNAHVAALGEKKLPYLVVVIDELADLMMLAPDETERLITRLAQLARATGIHLVIATQRPSVDVVTGLIKANFPARIAFAVASGVDSRVILDQPGADRLLGRGDMLFQAPDAPAPIRLQGAFVSDGEIQTLVNYWRQFLGVAEAAAMAAGGAVDALPAGIPLKQMAMWEEMQAEEESDPLYAEAIDLVRRQGRASISMLQRRMRIGYTRAARLIESMQEKGILGPAQPGNQGLEVLDYGPAGPPAEESGD
jgi:DNA segregation ATPase FtsK/SpoIIIE, S-DNA-T family